MRAVERGNDPQVMHSSKVYTKLSERLGLEDPLAVLNAMLAKIAKNLQASTAQPGGVHAVSAVASAGPVMPCVAVVDEA